MHIRFVIDVRCEDAEPSRVVRRIEGKIFEFVDAEEGGGKKVKVGRIGAYLVLVGRAVNEGESLLDAMDSIDQSVYNRYAALFNPENDEWSASVLAIYGDLISSPDVLYIESIDLEPKFTSMDIAAIVRETIDTFGSNCGLVAHEQPQDVKTWTNLGFRKLPDSDFYVYAPELLNQPAGDDQPVPASSVSWANRVPRGRRRSRLTSVWRTKKGRLTTLSYQSDCERARLVKRELGPLKLTAVTSERIEKMLHARANNESVAKLARA